MEIFRKLSSAQDCLQKKKFASLRGHEVTAIMFITNVIVAPATA
jgi:hypothetical protein